MSTGRGTVVEILGAPGAGKSGLASALSELDGVTVVKDHSRADISAAAWSVARSLPVVFSRPPQEVDRLRWLAWASRVSGAPRVARQRLSQGSSTVVFDQGAAYTLMRMLEVRGHRWGNAWWWRRSIETARLLDLLVILDADTDVLADRVTGRSKAHRADGMPAESMHAYLERERRSCHLVADVLAREGTDVRRVITTEVSIPEQTEMVIDAIGRRMAPRV
jgi:broad-specificity NMP kinase